MFYFECFKWNRKGFSLVELLLVIALMAIVGTGVLVVYRGVWIRNDLKVNRNIVVSNLRRAHIMALNSRENSSWGVKVGSGTLIVFKGEAYSSRDSAFDESFMLSNSVSISGTDEFVFESFSGEAGIDGTMTLITEGGDQVDIFVNDKGFIDY